MSQCIPNKESVRSRVVLFELALAGIVGCAVHRSAGVAVERVLWCPTSFQVIDIGTVRSSRHFSGYMSLERGDGVLDKKWPEEGKLRLLNGEGNQALEVRIEEGEFSGGRVAEGVYQLETCTPGFQTLIGTLVVDHEEPPRQLELITRLDL